MNTRADWDARTIARASHPRPTPALGTRSLTKSLTKSLAHKRGLPGPHHPTACGSFGLHLGSQCDRQFMHTWQKHSTVSRARALIGCAAPPPLSHPPPSTRLPALPHNNPPVGYWQSPFAEALMDLVAVYRTTTE